LRYEFFNGLFGVAMERFFPLPDYDLKNPDRVKVHIYGEIIDEKYYGFESIKMNIHA